VRRILREARERKSLQNPEANLKAIRRGAEFSYPTADIGEMLGKVEHAINRDLY